MITTFRIIIGSIILVLSVALIACISAQQGKSDGLGALTGNSDSDSYFNKNKGRTKDSILNKITIALSILLVFFILVLNYAIIV